MVGQEQLCENCSKFKNLMDQWHIYQPTRQGVELRVCHFKIDFDLNFSIQMFILFPCATFYYCYFMLLWLYFLYLLYSIWAKNRKTKKKKITVNLIKSCNNAFKLGKIFLLDQKIAPVNEVQLLNQVLLNQKKLML